MALRRANLSDWLKYAMSGPRLVHLEKGLTAHYSAATDFLKTP